MGGTSYSSDAHRTIINDYSDKDTDAIFTSNRKRRIDEEMNPNGVSIRESRDLNGSTVAININLDVTGSMGRIPEELARKNLLSMMETMISHGIEHPQIMFGAIGDHYSDTYPFQIGQFESQTDLVDKWLTKIYMEGRGGGTSQESYSLAWYFAARHTSIDCFEERGMKGFLFTIGDEGFHPVIEGATLQEIFGIGQGEYIKSLDLLEEVQQKYHVYHFHVQEGSYRDAPQVLDQWRDALKQHLIVVEDFTTIGETIASIVALEHGVDLNTITKSFDAATAGKVTKALINIPKGGVVATKKSGIKTL